MKKITVKLYSLHWDLFDRLINLVGLRRDTYLAKVLPAELAEIRSQDWANDVAGEKYLRASASLFDQVWKQVTITLPSELVDEIDSLCKEKRVPRDHLLNAILQFVTYRVLPYAIVLNQPRASMKFCGEDELLAAVIGWLGVESVDEYRETMRDEFYANELHYTEELIANIEATFQSLRGRGRTEQRRASNA